ncbi:cell division protein ZapE [Microbacterium sp. A196]|uniref:cell division protein ZapE n=1 Tax=Microbacterium sp. A196 TaxID=3457320 RepID=UPI003FD25FDB
MTEYALDDDQRTLIEALSRVTARSSSARGLYIHGPAGRGKSWVTNTFFEALPTKCKTRVHFHGFLDSLHRSIHDRRLRREGDVQDAVAHALDDITGRSRVLFFDEFHVHDSGDARLLTRLLEHVFRQDLTVIMTSNYAPDDLLPDPIWHHLFEPGIALIKANTETFELDGPIDYRTLAHDHSRGFASGSWTTSAVRPQAHEATSIQVRDREFPVLAARADELWISFAQLCETPTSTIEYLDWGRSFASWAIADVPAFADADAQAQQRFINVVDVLVDADVPTTFVSPLDLDAFLSGTTARPDAYRMASRLQLLRR